MNHQSHRPLTERILPVTAARSLLSCDVEFNGWQFQRQALVCGIANEDQLVANFLNSTKFKTGWTFTAAEFVRLMYGIFCFASLRNLRWMRG